MSSQYLIVDKRLLPKSFEKVVEAKRLLSTGEKNNITDACKTCNISRSTFYKYQDYVYSFENQNRSRKIIFSLSLSHKTGALSKLCNELSKIGISFLTISQSLPINNRASIMFSCDISNMKIDISEMKEILENIDEVSKFEILAIDN